ncbi:MAG: hypothetical protein LBC53_01605 [Spirochaetaceae bacterium]|jgi:hypothetical protein|nr:hypothetical protein [Spirochaetaceae bacterium]
MGKSLKIFATAYFSLFCCIGVFAQGLQGVNSITAEVQKINNILSDSKASGKVRHDALVSLARIQVLSGDVEAAAATWEEAAYAESGKRDDVALLENAACLMAMGEWDKAEAAVRVVLITSYGDRKAFLKAKYLNAQIEAFRSGDVVVLDAFLHDADFAPERAAIYYTLWNITGNNEYKTRLLIEHPESPETKALLLDAGASTGVSVYPGPMWLLPESRLLGGEPALVSAIQAPSGRLETGLPPMVQTGLFTTRENAVTQQLRLKNYGFDSSLSVRQSGGGEYWAVSVPSGSDLNYTILKLKEAGFEALPLF